MHIICWCFQHVCLQPHPMCMPKPNVQTCLLQLLSTRASIFAFQFLAVHFRFSVPAFSCVAVAVVSTTIELSCSFVTRHFSNHGELVHFVSHPFLGGSACACVYVCIEAFLVATAFVYTFTHCISIPSFPTQRTFPSRLKCGSRPENIPAFYTEVFAALVHTKSHSTLVSSVITLLLSFALLSPHCCHHVTVYALCCLITLRFVDLSVFKARCSLHF